MKEEIIIAGSGGQGILFAGQLLAQVAMDAGKNVTFFPSYGAEIRGGSANCTVVISDKEIGSPVIAYSTSLIVLNNVSLSRFLSRLKRGGLLLINSSLVNTRISRKDIKIAKIPASEIAEKKIGDLRTANIIILGKYLKLRKIILLKSITKTIKKIFEKKKEYAILNRKAVKYGYNYTEE